MNRNYSIFDISQFAESNYSAILYLQNRHLLRNNLICRCGAVMVLKQYADNVNLEHILRCPNQACRARKSLSANTFFENLHFPIAKYIYLFYYWASQTSITIASEHFNISETTLINHYNFCRDICSWKLLQRPIRLGGPGIIVETDESVFVKAKYNIGHALNRSQRWVFGLYDTQSKQGYLTFVNARDRDTLLPIIQQVVVPGSIIHSDEWAAYNAILSLPHPQPYHPFTVNHSRNFVHPITGVHTNRVESMWSRAKRRFKIMNGTSTELIPSFLDEFMWRDRYGSTTSIAFDNLPDDIAARYP